MTVHHCPKCELAFTWQTELDDHCRQDHPDFRHEYPAVALPTETPAVEDIPPPAADRHHLRANIADWLVPGRTKH